MRFPYRNFRLGGRKWRVKYVTVQTGLKYNPSAADCHGWCDDPTATIWLIKGDSVEYTLITFWHEVAHAMLYSMGYRDHDEAEVDRLGQMLYQLHTTGAGVIELER